MKILAIVSLFLLPSLVAFSQQVSVLDTAFNIIRPKYIGGDSALTLFLSQHLWYPPQERDAGKQGIVIVSFTVNADGTLSDFTIKKGISEALDEVALSVVRKIPKMIPALVNGQWVSFKHDINIQFRLF
jgi:protein TonB